MAAIPNSVPPQTFSNSPSRNPNRSSAHPKPLHLPIRPQWQLCGKFGHTAMKCYHRFDITYQHNNATQHLTHSAQTLSHVQLYSGANQVTIGGGQSLPIHNTGNKRFPFSSKFHSTYFFVKYLVTKKTLLQGYLKDGLYEFTSSSSTRVFLSTSSVPPSALWHSRLGHSVALILSKALASCIPPVSFQLNKMPPYTICSLAKSHILPFSLSFSHATQPLALIHTDLWGPAPHPSTIGAWYFLIFIYDYSRYI
ncbi:hypothetical protein AAG906_011759 [Vitis piasezkii]